MKAISVPHGDIIHFKLKKMKFVSKNVIYQLVLYLEFCDSYLLLLVGTATNNETNKYDPNNSK